LIERAVEDTRSRVTLRRLFEHPRRCERCNYDKEAPGWTVTTHRDDEGSHTAEFTAPARAVHRSRAPRIPEPPDIGDVEYRIANHLAEDAA
jgi:cation diffusion facilitator CzcD-associated flavoprotein CzcO